MSTTVREIILVYKTRMKMQEEGITAPRQAIKDLTRTIVEKLSKMPQDEELIFDDHMLKDLKGNVIVKFPRE